MVDDEQMRVTGTSSSQLTVVRGFAGTTAATHLISTAVYMLGIAMTENADDPISPVTQGEVDYNYHSLFQMGWQFSEEPRSPRPTRHSVTPATASPSSCARR